MFLTDAHFHLDQVCEAIHSPTVSLASLASRKGTPGAQPQSDANRIPLGYAVACFMLTGQRPRSSVTYSTMVRDPRLKLHFGVHPAHVDYFKSKQAKRDVMAHTLDCCMLQGVVAIGEIGVDYFRGKSSHQRRAQREFLEEFLTLVRKSPKHRHLPLVLHVRESEVEGAPSASRACLDILKSVNLPKDHSVYRHCYLGNLAEAKEWLEQYPNTVFGFGPKVMTGKGARSEAVTVFRNLSFRHIVVETDAVKLNPQPEVRSAPTPWSTYIEFRWLAALRGLSLAETMKRVNNSMLKFYGLNYPAHLQR